MMLLHIVLHGHIVRVSLLVFAFLLVNRQRSRNNLSHRTLSKLNQKGIVDGQIHAILAVSYKTTLIYHEVLAPLQAVPLLRMSSLLHKTSLSFHEHEALQVLHRSIQRLGNEVQRQAEYLASDYQ
ncbi:Uncharacterised protein [Streptococcus pneumoniae]|nr:Uncharacterised protein [Streptococcus pneumoniae]CJA55550.1 Uncharacterised protein [Streptococcus pneumoniae]CJC59948.1 Uncharacterised protein [Streptococcus pneumoniae]CKE28649.1 Uncharacterised protein [Streptococcus pneumoniae]